MQTQQQSNKPTNQRTKLSGFTLIELLVVIVIIGILSTISTATFKSYFGKARDAERQAAVQNLALMIKVDSADKWDDSKYMYDYGTNPVATDDFEDLADLASSNDFRFPRGSKNICYFIAMAQGTDNVVGDDNEFVVATWGETTASSGAYIGGTSASSGNGLIIDGTQQAVKNLVAKLATTEAAASAVTSTATDSIGEKSFACEANFINNSLANSFLVSPIGNHSTSPKGPIYLKITSDGQVVVGSAAG